MADFKYKDKDGNESELSSYTNDDTSTLNSTVQAVSLLLEANGLSESSSSSSITVEDSVPLNMENGTGVLVPATDKITENFNVNIAQLQADFWEYSSSKDYVVGQYVNYNNYLYRCKANNGVTSPLITVAPDAVPIQEGDPNGEDYWEIIPTKSYLDSQIAIRARALGETVISNIPLNDVCYHEKDGALISGSGNYSKFVNYIAKLYEDNENPNLFVTELEWQQSVTDFGFCTKFVYNSTNNTVRLPKINNEHGDLIKSYHNGSDWYRIYADGWCEQGGQTSNTSNNDSVVFLKSYVSTPTIDANPLTLSNASTGGFTCTYDVSTSGFSITKFGSRYSDGAIISANGYFSTIWTACGYTNISTLKVSTIYEYIVISTSANTNDEAKLNKIVQTLNVILNTSDATEFIDTLATKQYVDENQSSGLNLFDIVVKDHVLTYGKDLEGFALLGTWVYKTAVDGSRYGYPDFVQKCLDEYDEATDDVIPYKKWEQPILSANGTLGGDSFAVQASGEYSATTQAWRAFDGTKDSNKWVANSASYPQHIIFYNPNKLLVKKLTITNRSELGNVTAGIIYGSNDGENWEQITEFTNTNTTANSIWYIDLNSNNKWYLYHKIYISGSGATSSYYVGLSEIEITAYDDYISVKRHSNGHIYFDVADIETVNTYFNTYGHAWFYGIDETNERVFLPRQVHGKLIESYKNGSDWYRIYQDGWCEQGSTYYKGSPVNGDNTIILLKPYKDLSFRFALDGYLFSTTRGRDNVGSEIYPSRTTSSVVVYIDGAFYGYTWQASGYIDLENVEVTPSYDYMVVGNNIVQQASTEVIDATTTNNDTVPLFAPYYFDYTPNNLSWLKGGAQSNSGDLYKTCYNELVNVLNGETKYGSLKVIDQANVVPGTDYSLYWIVDQTTETFRTPTATQQRFVVKTYQNGSDWYRIYNDGWCEQGGSIDATSISDGNYEVVLLKPYANANYFATQNRNISSNTYANYSWINVWGRTTTSFRTAVQTYNVDWFACGYIDLTNETFDTSLYFKVANAVENIQMLDVGAVTDALTLKADTTLANASNVAQAFKDMSIGWGRPDYSAGISITISSSNPYTAPSDGWIIGSFNIAGAGSADMFINGSYVGPDNNGGQTITVPVTKNDIVSISSGTQSTDMYFYPCKGAN